MVRALIILASAVLASSHFLAPAGKLVVETPPDAMADDAADDDDEDSSATATSTLNVTIDKTGPLGMHVEESDDSDGLKIKDIQTTGLIAKYNKVHPAQKIVPGMDIVNINGATDTDAIGDEIRNATHLAMKLEKTTTYRRHCKAKATAALLKAKDSALQASQKKQGASAEKAPDRLSSMGSTMDQIDAQLEATDRKSLVDNEEFLLGLLIMHQTSDDWVPEQFLDAVCDLAHGSPMITNLYWHHNDYEPMAAQLAALMDEERKSMSPTLAPPMLQPGDFSGVLGKMMGSANKQGATKK